MINLDQIDQYVCMRNDTISATVACGLLGITPATLYAYVSRGLLESRPGVDHRSRVYLRLDVERLVQRQRRGSSAASGAAHSLDRGLPVMETKISLIQPDGPYYRGLSAVSLARAGATLESVARILWDCAEFDPFAVPPAADWPERVQAIAYDEALPPLERALASIPLLGLDVRHSFNSSTRVRQQIAGTLLRQNAALLVATDQSSLPVHQLLAQTWVPQDDGFSDIVRMALVLCADHELNVSAFAARVVASTGAPLHATVCSGLAALSGPRHGGATARAYAFIEAALATPSSADFIASRWERGDDLPGFGHALYPHGDARAAVLMQRLHALHGDALVMQGIDALVASAEEISGTRPNVDFALAAICNVYGLPGSPALVLFATARLAGWLAHAMEQQELGKLIRPRATYIGIRPEEPTVGR